jgi:peptidoglycan/LPS O-acetylase OafA/YrhL
MNYRYRPEIDGLRAIAVIAVVFYHANFKIIFENKEYNFLSGGYLGVDIFYVISGYLITQLILNDIKTKNFSFLNFYERRARRLLPALFVVIFTSIIAGYFLMLPSQFKNLSDSALSSLFFISNFYFYFSDNYFAEASSLKPLLHTWSLSIEEQFYLIFPPLLYFLYKKNKNIIKILLLLIIFSLAFSQFGSFFFKELNFYILISRIWELAFGALIAFYHFRNYKITSKILNKKLIYFFSLILILIPFFIYNEETPHPSLMTIFTILGTGIIIFYQNEKNLLKSILSSKPFVCVGLISYSFYLWHYPILAFKKIKSQNLSEFDKVEAILLALVLSVTSYFFIERPFRNKKTIKSKSFIKVILSLFLIIFIICFQISNSKGIPKRYSQEILSIIDFNYDYKKIYREGTCLIEDKLKSKKNYFKKCKIEKKNNKRNLFIWGDSLAAHLYPGISNKYQDNYTIWQRTTNGCKPAILPNKSKETLKNCALINSLILEEILKEKPEKIFLSAFWNKKDLKEIEKIIRILKENNLSQIYLIGPSPRWHDPLPKILLKKYRLSRRIPEYLSDKNHKGNFILDNQFNNFAKNNNLQYVSPINILCKKNYTCLTRVGNQANSIINWDENHFTEKASIFIFRKFID